MDKYIMMYELEHQTVYAITRLLFWRIFPNCDSTYIISFLRDKMKPYLTLYVHVLLVTTQSTDDDVANVFYDMTIVMQALEK